MLIADDDPDLRFLVKSWLELHGAFDVVADVADGLATVEAAERTLPDAAVLDLAMPRMDGLQAAAALRRLLPDLRIVIHSSFSADRMAQTAVDAGADVYLEKTPDSHVLCSTLEALFPELEVATPGAPEEATGEPPVATSRELLLLDLLLTAIGSPAAVLRPETGDQGAVEGFRVERVNTSAREHTGWDVGAWVALPGELPDAAVAAERLHEHLAKTVALTGVQVQRTPSGEVLVAWGRTTEPSAEATELLEAAVISNPVGAALFDASGRLVMANSVADRLLADSALLRADSPKRRICAAETRVPLAEEDLPLVRASRGEHVENMELFIAGDDDSGVYVRVSAHPVLGSGGEPAGAVLSVLDDTAAKRAEHELAATHEELERSNRELEDFAYTASHDLYQPLQTIYGFAQLLREEGFEDSHAEDHLNRIVTGCERMNALIGDLLTYSLVTIDAVPFEPVELGPLVEEVLDLIQSEVESTGARVTIGPLPRVRADRTQMGQLFQNLLVNAGKYVAPGVTPDIQVTSARRDQSWEVVVTDNGIGIPSEDRERIFAMFQRLKTPEEYAGTGIGLAICAKIVERHGGRIWVEDNPGGGSRFHFTLPDLPVLDS